jgi:uncharacterized protein (DUF2062 family)
MLFRSRARPGLLERVRVAAWPRRSWSRSAKYLSKRVLRLSATPHAIAAGVAAGCFASFTPFIGLHFILSFVFAFIIGGNMIAAAIGTAVGNPLTFPFIWATTFNIGNMILGHPGHRVPPGELSRNLAERSLDAIYPLIGPMLAGGLAVGIPVSAALYVLVFYSVRGFQSLRRERLAERRRQQNGDVEDGAPATNPDEADLTANAPAREEAPPA